MTFRKILLAGGLMAAGLSLFAQQTPSGIPSVGETIEVSIVNVDVFVTDKQGRRVHGLTKDDFEIRESGKVQAITNFAEYRGQTRRDSMTVETPAAAPPAPGAPQREPRTLVVFIEHQRLTRSHRDAFIQSLQELVRTTMGPGDRATVLLWANALQERVPLTTDVDRIQRELALIGRGLEGQQFDREENLRREVESDLAFDENLITMGPRLMSPSGADSGYSLMPPDPLGEGPGPNECAARELWQIRRKGRTMAAVINGLAAVRGRKIFIMAMRRFGEDASVACGSALNARNSWYSTSGVREQLIAAANASGVTIYAVHPAVAQSSLPTIEDRQMRAGTNAREYDILNNELRSLQSIAVATGGKANWGPEVVQLMADVEADLDSYYSLAYRASAAGSTDKVRNIVVRTRREGLVVRTRSKVVEKTERTRMKDRALGALSYAVGGATLPFDVVAGKPKRNGKRYTIPLNVKIPIAALTTLPDGRQHRGSITIYVAASAGAATYSDVTERTFPFSIPEADLANAKQSHFRYDLEVVVDDLARVMSVVVYDDVGREFGIARLEPRSNRS